MQPSLKAKIHASHIGTQGCLRHARERTYWPGMNRELTELVSKCPVSNSHPRVQPKEPLISHEIREDRWQGLSRKSGLLFEFLEVDRVTTKTAKEMLGKLKQHFARQVLPLQLISDNGPPYNSQAFKEFAQFYDFKHITSSPGYPSVERESGKCSENCQALMRKAAASKGDPHLAILEWHNTPTEGLDTSPVQRLFSCRTTTPLPTASGLLEPAVSKNTRQQLQHQKTWRAKYYNPGSRKLSKLQQGNLVRIKPLRTTEGHKLWVRATVEDKVNTWRKKSAMQPKTP